MLQSRPSRTLKSLDRCGFGLFPLRLTSCCRLGQSSRQDWPVQSSGDKAPDRTGRSRLDWPATLRRAETRPRKMDFYFIFFFKNFPPKKHFDSSGATS